jgi:hypothetical protein
LLAWVKGLVDGSEIKVKIAASTVTLTAFSIEIDSDSNAAAEFLAACVPSVPTR